MRERRLVSGETFADSRAANRVRLRIKTPLAIHSIAAVDPLGVTGDVKVLEYTADEWTPGWTDIVFPWDSLPLPTFAVDADWTEPDAISDS